LTFFRHFRHVAKFRHVENGQFWCYFDGSGHFKTFWFFDLFSSLSTRVEISTCRKWSFLGYFDVLDHFKTFWFFDIFSSLSTRVEISTCRKWSFLSKMVDQRSSGVVKRHLTPFYEKKFFDPKTPLFCQKQHLTSDAAGHDLLTSSSNLALVTSQRSCIPSLVILGQEGHELSCPQTDDRQTDRQNVLIKQRSAT
jgi:hypothetical protein